MKKKSEDEWIVDSFTDPDKTYKVTREKKGWRCTCPHYIIRGQKCKHISAVEVEIGEDIRTESQNKNRKYLLISGLQKEIRRGNTDSAIEVAEKLEDDKWYLFKRLLTILFEDVYSGTVSDEILGLFLAGSKNIDFKKVVGILAEQQKSRVNDDLVYWIWHKGIGKGCEELVTKLISILSGGIISLSNIELVAYAKTLADEYWKTNGIEVYMAFVKPFLSEIEFKVIKMALKIGVEQSLLYPLTKKLELKEKFQVETKARPEKMGEFWNYWIDGHSFIGKIVLNVVSKEFRVDYEFTDNVVFYGEGALLENQVGSNYGYNFAKKAFGEGFEKMMQSEFFWNKLNKVRNWGLRKFGLF